MNSEVDHALVQRLRSDSLQPVLIVAPHLPPFLVDYFGDVDNIDVTHFVFESLEKTSQQLERYEFAVVLESTFENLQVEAAQQLVARLRDMHSKLLWVEVSDSPDSVFSSKDAMAQGMRMVDPTKFGKSETKWFEFSLKFYKPVPQWLNARDWANPERWDKDRW